MGKRAGITYKLFLSHLSCILGERKTVCRTKAHLGPAAWTRSGRAVTAVPTHLTGEDQTTKSKTFSQKNH